MTDNVQNTDNNESKNTTGDVPAFDVKISRTDITFEELISMYDNGILTKPSMQNDYGTTKLNASKLIAEILEGENIPIIFLVKSGCQKIVVSGYEEMMSVYYYVKGKFPKERKIFRLSDDDEIDERLRNKTFKELPASDKEKILSTCVHAVIYESDRFDRLNK